MAADADVFVCFSPAHSLVWGGVSSTSWTLISSSLEEEEEDPLLASARIRSSSLDSLSGGGVTWRDPAPSLQQQGRGRLLQTHSPVDRPTLPSTCLIHLLHSYIPAPPLPYLPSHLCSSSPSSLKETWTAERSSLISRCTSFSTSGESMYWRTGHVTDM